MTDRPRRITALAISLIAVGALGWMRWTVEPPTPPEPPTLYTASDPGRIGTTGLPQLVEFFHPG